MTIESVFVTATLGVQAVVALLLAALLTVFRRDTHQQYLRVWAWSWLAFALFLGAALSGLLLASASAGHPAFGCVYVGEIDQIS